MRKSVMMVKVVRGERLDDNGRKRDYISGIKEKRWR